MVNNKYFIKKGESGLYNLYRKVGDSERYQMSFIHSDIAREVCHLLNREAKAFGGMKESWSEVKDELKELKREFFEYRLEHPEDE